ncbi:hypothetical protein ACTQWG_01420 [Blautia sp. HCP3S3_H10_1]|uniref:hypothetical protein n=1 Tax=unclassified Blautia TaxID=2648079 RepID=UPI003F8F4C8F|nr:hypothetical protein [Clostridia bacterium]
MSKFLKFIVHFVVICTILCVIALAVPPFFGVTTEIRDDSTVKSNLAMGSVTYAIPVKTEEAALGTPILVNDENDAVYRYTLASADVANGTGTAMDPTVSQGQPINVAIGSYLPKIVVTIPFIGYLMAATKSIEGLIVLGLSVLFLIILYVIAELWKRDPDDYDDDYPEDTEPGYVKSRKELKREEKRKEREYRDEEREIKAQGKRNKKEKRKIRTGGFVDEIDEDDFDTEEEERPQRTVQSATSEAHELLKKEVAAATAQTRKPAKKSAKPAAQAKKAAPKKKAEPEIMEDEDEPVEIKKLAIPRYSPAQLAAKAKKEGDAPDIVKDEITKVTLFDYSDIFADEEEDDDEYYDDED